MYNFNIEQSVICSVLEAVYISSDDKILSENLDVNYFFDSFHKKIVLGINRLKELSMPVDAETIRRMYKRADKWSFSEDNYLLNVMGHVNPFTTYKLWKSYYKILEDDYYNSSYRRLAI